MANGDARVAVGAQASWLSQGDIFRSVPLAYTTLTEGEYRVGHSFGPAMLLTHDCVLDKRSRAGNLTLERLYFLPLRTTDGLDPGRSGELRRKAAYLRPFEPLYLGEVDDLGESFVTMSSPVAVPAGYFQLAPIPMSEGADDDIRAHAQRNDTRLGRLHETVLTLLRAKWTAYWTRLLDEGSTD